MNTYPLISTTFIGREIAALERQGVKVNRYAIRRWKGKLVDAGDLAEQAKTKYLLDNPGTLLMCVTLAFFRSPLRFFSALALTLRLIRNARGRVAKHFAYLAEAAVLLNMAGRDNVTHLHAHFSTNSTTVAMLAHELGGPEFSFTVHGPDELLAPIENSTAEKVTRAKFVACISHFARSQVMLFSQQAHWDKLKIVHCGVIPSRYGRMPHHPYGKHVLFVGRLAAVKGVPLLLEAVAILKEAHPDIRLTIVGDGPDREKLEAQTATLGLAAEVEFLGFQSQESVADILAQVDLLVLPSFAEGVPVVLMEAMASRVPVIASNVAGVSELVLNDVVGFTVPPADVSAIIDRANSLLGDPQRSLSFGNAGRDKVESEFNVDTEAGRLSALFATI